MLGNWRECCRHWSCTDELQEHGCLYFGCQAKNRGVDDFIHQVVAGNHELHVILSAYIGSASGELATKFTPRARKVVIHAKRVDHDFVRIRSRHRAARSVHWGAPVAVDKMV